jgi:hypothetical protein
MIDTLPPFIIWIIALYLLLLILSAFLSQSLEYFLKYERVSTPINLANEAIDDHLAKKLTRLCGSEKKLAVGSAEHKRIIEMKLVSMTFVSFLVASVRVNNIHRSLLFQGITCLHVGVPDCEVINCCLKNHMRTLFPEEKSEMNKRDCPLIRKELITVLRQHNFDVKPEMVRLPLVLPNFSHLFFRNGRNIAPASAS